MVGFLALALVVQCTQQTPVIPAHLPAEYGLLDERDTLLIEQDTLTEEIADEKTPASEKI